jgi:hypothetical protein
VTRSIEAPIEIAAPAQVVWDVLADVDAYPEWNPFLVRFDGRLVEGERPRIRFSPPGGRPITMRPRVLVVDAPRELRWLGHLGVRGIFDGEHRFALEPLGPTRTRLVQSERFGGILVPLTGSLLRRTEQGFQAMNEALRGRAEAQAAQR